MQGKLVWTHSPDVCLVRRARRAGRRDRNSAISSEHSAIISEHSAINSEHSAINSEHLAISSEHSAINSEHLAISSEHAGIGTRQSAGIAGCRPPITFKEHADGWGARGRKRAQEGAIGIGTRQSAVNTRQSTVEFRRRRRNRMSVLAPKCLRRIHLSERSARCFGAPKHLSAVRRRRDTPTPRIDWSVGSLPPLLSTLRSSTPHRRCRKQGREGAQDAAEALPGCSAGLAVGSSAAMSCRRQAARRRRPPQR
jgi:hypothetical protein